LNAGNNDAGLLNDRCPCADAALYRLSVSFHTYRSHFVWQGLNKREWWRKNLARGISTKHILFVTLQM